MEFYHIKDSYINFLKQYDEKVPDNKNEKRPYVGVVFEVGGIKYYAPFSSPKPKHKNIKRIAENLRNILMKDESLLSSYELKVKNRCCDLKKLESVCDEFVI